MGIRLILYLAIIFLGGIVGYKDLVHKTVVSKMNLIQSLCLLSLLFIMGIKIGGDKKVISSFFKLGYQAVIISVFSIALSVLFVMAIKKFVIDKDEEEGDENEC
ncbi:LysO family transporter [Clostridium sp. D2Q-11]|uniref:LysO family transporter n=1 Tax=Anaeromonas frigoriresistens TaxID=2683708 RepID=A0A942ZAR4_9FIRM|nr:LysO family transporter [Anaeromonas frigoriresistens]MBS4540035.1 LysO family transporter [Anaeromonas frigoriresistens]